MSITQPAGCFKCKRLNCICPPAPTERGLSEVQDVYVQWSNMVTPGEVDAFKRGAQAAIAELARYIKFYREVHGRNPDAMQIFEHMDDWSKA